MRGGAGWERWGGGLWRGRGEMALGFGFRSARLGRCWDASTARAARSAERTQTLCSGRMQMWPGRCKRLLPLRLLLGAELVFFHRAKQRPGLRWVRESSPLQLCVLFKPGLISRYRAKRCGAAAGGLRLRLPAKVPHKHSEKVPQALVLQWGAFRKSLFTASECCWSQWESVQA